MGASRKALAPLPPRLAAGRSRGCPISRRRVGGGAGKEGGDVLFPGVEGGHQAHLARGTLTRACPHCQVGYVVEKRTVLPATHPERKSDYSAKTPYRICSNYDAGCKYFEWRDRAPQPRRSYAGASWAQPLSEAERRAREVRAFEQKV